MYKRQSLDGGENWQKLPGTPNMSFRDLVIQKRENDLVAASFGRGFYVLDDYSALREMTPEALKAKGKLFQPRTAKWYIPRSNLGNTGADFYIAKNPDFGAVFTYHLADGFSSLKKERKKREKALNKKGANIPFPGYTALDEENNESAAKVWITIKDADGNIIRHLQEKAKKGTHRIAWDLRHTSTQAINPMRSNRSRWNSGGPMVTPGQYSAQLSLEKDGVVTAIGEAVVVDVQPIREGVLNGVDYATLDNYRKELTAVQNDLQRLMDQFDQAETTLKGLKMAVSKTPAAPASFIKDLFNVEKDMTALMRKAEGSPARDEIGERNPPTIRNYMRAAYRGLSTTYGPTPLHRKSLVIAKEMLEELQPEIERISKTILPGLSERLKQAGAPYIIGD